MGVKQAKSFNSGPSHRTSCIPGTNMIVIFSVLRIVSWSECLDLLVKPRARQAMLSLTLYVIL